MKVFRPAYTLLELLLVMAVMLLLATFAYQSVDVIFGDSRVQAATDQVRAAFTNARIHAVDEGRPYRFAILPSKGKYRIAPDSPEFWSDIKLPRAADDKLAQAKQPWVVEQDLPKGIQFSIPAPTEPLLADTEPDLTRARAAPEAAKDEPPSADRQDPSRWSALTVFMPDGRPRQDAKLVFRMRGARPALMKLRAFTGFVTVVRVPLKGPTHETK